MSKIVLVHGAWHGGWCWYKLVPILEGQGHSVTAVDLPGHGRDKTPTSQVSLASYVASLSKTIEAIGEPVILVGHSLGGITISQTAETCAARVKGLVYVAGFLPQSGESARDVLRHATSSLLLPNRIPSEDQSSLTIRESALQDVFYSDCTREDIALAKLLLVPQAVEPTTTPATLTPEQFGRIPKYYIECTQDRALPIESQRSMQARATCAQVLSMNTSHSPFFSRPSELAGHMANIARSV